MTVSPHAAHEPYDVIVLGAGYAGLMAALRLGQRRLGLRVALVNREEAFVERVRLQEAMVDPVKPRIASLARYLKGTNTEFILGTVLSLNATQNTVTIEVAGSHRELVFKQLVYAMGSHVDSDNARGAQEMACTRF